MTHITVWKLGSDIGNLLFPVTFKNSPKTLDEASQQLPGGAYTTFRTYHQNMLLHLDWHVNRLEETAALDDHAIAINRPVLYQAIRQLLSKNTGEKRIRIILDLEQVPGMLYFQVEPLTLLPDKLYQNGAQVVTTHIARKNPKAKLTNFINHGKSSLVLPKGVNEALMVDQEGRILEGLSSNFFAVKSGEIWTEDKVALSGITRTLVLDEANKAGVPVHLNGILLNEIHLLDEAFITSSSRGVLPVTTIDNIRISTGSPGEITKLVMERYRRRVEVEIREI
jgi:branched-chain amino acid aminotransferase